MAFMSCASASKKVCENCNDYEYKGIESLHHHNDIPDFPARQS